MVENFIDPKYRGTVRQSLTEFMTDQGYFGNEFIQNLLRGENKMPCIAWWSLVQKQAPTMQLRAFASAVVMIQSFPCSAASIERVNSCLGHSRPLECCRKLTIPCSVGPRRPNYVSKLRKNPWISARMGNYVKNYVLNYVKNYVKNYVFYGTYFT